jgi:DNA-binding MarR family transcriptional regulator
MLELKVLQAIRLKGRVGLADLVATLDEDEGSISKTVDSLCDSGLLISGKTVRLSPQGRERLAELLGDERAGADAAAITDDYDQFRHVNAEFKALVADWQLKDGAPNDHQDTQYDSDVLLRLDEVHAKVIPIITSLASQLPRLALYGDKLNNSYEKVRAGNTTWLTRPIVDSYHTVWFELHEELIIAAGLTRDGEAAAGHAH